MSTLSELQKWYHSQCNGDWEHAEGISIGTLDNPGWTFAVSLQGTELEYKEFKEHSYGISEHGQNSGDDWLTCKVQEKKFKAFGGPLKLQEIIQVFLDWAASKGEQNAAPNAAPPHR